MMMTMMEPSYGGFARSLLHHLMVALLEDLENLGGAGVGVHLSHVSAWVSWNMIVIGDAIRAFPLSWSLMGETHLALATGHGDVDETASVLQTLHGAALGLLLLLLLVDLYYQR